MFISALRTPPTIISGIGPGPDCIMSPSKKAVASTVDRLTVPTCILALDMSLTRTGWAHVNTTTGRITQGLIETGTRRGMARLAYLREQVLILALPQSFGLMPDPSVPPPTLRVFIEGYAFGARGQAVISLGELGGVIRLAFYDRGTELIEVPPMRVKKFVSGKGNIQKQLVLKEVYKRWGADFDDDNVADAYALLQLGLALCGKNEKSLVAFQEQVVSEMLKARKASTSM